MSFDAELNHRLDALREQNLFRQLRRVDSPQSPRIEIGGKAVLNFSSNDYLGLANHPAVKQAAQKAIEKYGAGSGASRLVCGSLAPFHELEETLARFKKTEAALSFSTGYTAASGAICALVGRNDIIILDKLVHASIVDAAKLSGAKIRVFSHNDLNDLEEKLKWAMRGVARSPSGTMGTNEPPEPIQPLAVSKHRPVIPPLLGERAGVRASLTNLKTEPQPHVLIITESVFSMDGDTAPLREIVTLKEKYGAWLMVDEAHATGVLGKNGRGLADALGVANRIEIQMGTLGKALGASGGYICGSRPLIDLLVNSARTFVFSTAPIPAAAAAATAALQLAQSAEGDKLRQRLHSFVEQFQSTIRNSQSAIEGAIVPIVLGGETKALEASAKLWEQNIFVPAIRYPSVARGQARLRITLTAAHTNNNISRLVDALKTLNIGPRA